MKRVLTLPLKGEYFDAIADGSKPEEFRLDTPYWRRRLLDREYDTIMLLRGYPHRSDTARRLERPWRGVCLETITHPFFGPEPVQVFVIKVN